MSPSFTLAQKVGRMFLTGFLGHRMTGEMAELIERHHVGNFVFFDQRNIQNPPQLLSLVSEIREKSLIANALPPFIAVDNEGGVNSQLLSVGTVFPGSLALAAGGDPRQAGLEGAAIAREIRSVGLTANFAPVLDLYDGGNPGTGVRCFGDCPRDVTAYARPYLRAHQKAGILNVAKHYPGLSVTDTDPHQGLPVIRRSRKEIRHYDLAPYRALIKSGLPAIMTAHALYPAFDKTYPATLSRRILTGILREELGFRGVLMTDDLEMPAIEEKYGLEGAVELAVRAGADMVMVCHTFGKMKRAVEHLVKLAARDKEIARRVEESFGRITRALSRFPRGRAVLNPRSALRSPAHLRLAAEQADRSVTLIRDREGLLPLRLPKGARLGVVNPFHTMYGWNQPVRLDLAFSRILGSRSVRSALFDPRFPGDSEKGVLKMARDSDMLVAGTYDAQFSPPQVRMIRELAKLKKPLVVLATRSPQDLVKFPEIGTTVACYNFYQVSLDAAARAICGKTSFRGKLPVQLLESKEKQ